MAIQSEIILSANITKAERQIKKLEDRIKKLDTKPINVKLKLDTTDIRRAERELTRLARARRSALQVDERVNRSGGGGSGGATAGLLPGLAAGASASQGITKATNDLNQAIADVAEKTKEARTAGAAFAQSQQEVADAAEKVLSIQSRITQREKEIADLTKKRNFAQGQSKAITTRIEKGLIKNVDAIRKAKVQQAELNAEVSDLNTKISRATASQRMLTKEMEKYATAAKGLPKTPFRAPGVPGGPGGGGGGGRRRGGGTATAVAAGGALSGLKGSLVGLAASVVGVNEALQETRRILNATLERGQSEVRLSALSEGFDDYAAVLDRTNVAAEKYNISQTAANQSFAQLYGRLRPLGLTLEEVNTAYEGFNTAAIISGTTASEARGALLQLSQALGSGVLRGQEFNSVAEQTPAIVRAIGEELGVPIGQLKDLAKEGKITSDIIINALARIQRDGADRLTKALDSPQQKVIKLQNRLEDLRVAIGDLVQPAVITYVNGLTITIEKATGKVELYTEALNKLLKPVGGLQISLPLLADAFAKLPAEIVKSLPGLGQIIRALETIDQLAQRFVGTSSGPRDFGANYKEQERRLFEQAGGYNPYAPTEPLKDRLGIIDPPLTGGGSSGTSAEDTLKRQLETGQELSREFSRQLQLLRATDDLERELLQIEFDREDRALNIADAAESQRAALEGLSNELAELERLGAAQDSFASFFQTEQNFSDQLDALNAQLDVATAITREDRKQAELQLQLLQLRQATTDLAPEQLQALEEATRKLFEATNLSPLNQYIKDTTEALYDTEAQLTKVAQTVEGQLASGIANFFNSIIDGSKSAEEAFADMLKGMGQALIQQASVMIAQYIALGIARMFAFGGSTFGHKAHRFKTILETSSAAQPQAEPTADPVAANTPYIVGERSNPNSSSPTPLARFTTKTKCGQQWIRIHPVTSKWQPTHR